MSNLKIEIKINAKSVEHGYFLIPRESALFPLDAWGGPNATLAAIPVIFEFGGTGESVSTDIDGEKKIPRSARGQLKRFYLHNKLSGGELIVVSKTAERRYLVSCKDSNHVVKVDGSEEKDGPTDRRSVVVSRLVRDTAITKEIKLLYEYRCQICRIAIMTGLGPYAEAAHIRPLGSPHHGRDVRGNVLCLCPNHHVMFDNGGFTVNDDFTLAGIEGSLFVDESHNIGKEFLAYHRNLIG